MRKVIRLLVLAVISITLTSCYWGKETKPVQTMTPGSRLIYSGGGWAVWTVCDRGNRVYMTDNSPGVTVIPGGCPDGQP